MAKEYNRALLLELMLEILSNRPYVEQMGLLLDGEFVMFWSHLLDSTWVQLWETMMVCWLGSS